MKVLQFLFVKLCKVDRRFVRYEFVGSTDRLMLAIYFGHGVGRVKGDGQSLDIDEVCIGLKCLSHKVLAGFVSNDIWRTQVDVDPAKMKCASQIYHCQLT